MGLLFLLLTLQALLPPGLALSHVFTNSFLVKLRPGIGDHLASDVAKRHGFENRGPVST